MFFDKGINGMAILALLKTNKQTYNNNNKTVIWTMKLSFGNFPRLLEEKKVVMNSAWKEIWHTTYYFFHTCYFIVYFSGLEGCDLVFY